MIPLERITAGWLLDGLQLVNAVPTPPGGYEFRGLMLEPGHDPIPQLGRIFRGPPHCLAFEAALREAIADRSLYRHEPDFAQRVMLSLTRLLDYFGSPEAVLHLLVKLERGEFKDANRFLVERVAAVGARQAERLRTRFEAALKAEGMNIWQPKLVLPFLRADIVLNPSMWPKIAVARQNELSRLKNSDGINGLALVLGALCRDGEHDQRPKEVLTGLARIDRGEKGAFTLLFDPDGTMARLALTSRLNPARRPFGDDSTVQVTLNFYQHETTLGALKSLREPRPGEKDIAAQTAHSSALSEWLGALVDAAHQVEEHPEAVAA